MRECFFLLQALQSLTQSNTEGISKNGFTYPNGGGKKNPSKNMTNFNKRGQTKAPRFKRLKLIKIHLIHPAE